MTTRRPANGLTRRTMLTDGRPQLTLGDVLNVLIDSQFERDAGGGREFDPTKSPLPSVSLHEHLTREPSNFLVMERLEPV